MIVDCHVHSFRYPEHWNRSILLQSPTGAVPEGKIKESADRPAKMYLDEARGAVDKAILVGLNSWDTLGLETANDYIADTAAQYPDKFAWACCVRPAEEGAAAEVERCVMQRGAVAIGELGPAYANYHVNDRQCFPVWEMAEKLDIPVIVHAGPGPARTLSLRYSDLADVDDMATTFPRLKIVIAHMGYYRYEDTVFLMQKHPNVFADISDLTRYAGATKQKATARLPVVNYPYFHLLYPLLYYFSQTWGAHIGKLVWGTDWPGTNPKAAIQTFISINKLLSEHNMPEIPQKYLDDILYENWKKVFMLVA